MRAFLLLWAVLLVPAAAHCEVYRWVDGNGQIHYSQTPPPGSRDATLVRPPPPPNASPNQDALNGSLDKARKDEPAAKQAADVAAAAKAKQDADCRDVMNQLSTLEANGPRRTVIKNDKGGVDRMTTEQFDQRRNELQGYVRDKCS